MRSWGKEMRFLRFLVPLFAVALLLISSQVYSVRVVTAAQKAQKEDSAHSKKHTRFHYVCPMHEDVTSTKRGVCPKCKMKLVRKPVVTEPSSN